MMPALAAAVSARALSSSACSSLGLLRSRCARSASSLWNNSYCMSLALKKCIGRPMQEQGGCVQIDVFLAIHESDMIQRDGRSITRGCAGSQRQSSCSLACHLMNTQMWGMCTPVATSCAAASLGATSTS